MNQNYKKRKLVLTNKLLIAAAATSLFFGSTNAWANQSYASESAYEVESQSQNPVATGTVLDPTGAPVVGASVVEVGTTHGTTTGINGQFSLEAKAGATLQISFVGYRTAEVKAGQNLTVKLAEDAGELDAIVVLGYGVQKKANLTGAVSTVDVSKTLEARPQADVSKALQGVVPGLSIINKSGAINGKPTITIRGTGTLSNEAKSDPLIVVDGVAMSDISFLNTQDIESISVLKDAASTSIYGTRAAFGVILITTKAAKHVDRVSVTYTNNFAWDTSSILPDYPDVATQAKALQRANSRAGLTNELFGMTMDEAFINKANDWKQRHHGKKSGRRNMIEGEDFDLRADGTGLYYADWDVVGINYRDWKPSQSHNLSVQGSSGKTSYFLSLGYNREEGIMRFNPDELKKYTTSMNLTTDIAKWLQVGTRFSYSDKVYTEPAARRDTYQYMWRWGSFFEPQGTYNGIDMKNSVAYRRQAGDDKTRDSYTRLGAFLKATPVKGLTVNVDYTFNIQHTNEKSAGLPVYLYNSWANITEPGEEYGGTSTYVYQSSGRDKSYALNVYANYALTIADKHNFNFMLGANAEEGTYEFHSSQRKSLLDNNLPEFNLADGDQTVSGAHSEWGTAGWFGRINYDYRGIWLVELNGRYDGSSKFPKGDRWAFFPSGSLGYRLSEENYFEPVRKVISNAKIRGSFGEIGNQAIGSNMFISTLSKYTDTNTHWLNSDGVKLVTFGMPSLVSKTLKWERIQTLDVGVDLGFLKNELNATFDWYQRTTLDMLAPGKTMPQILGASAPLINAGTLRTRGWEFTIDWHHTFNEVNVYANASIGDFKTKITKWDNDNKLLNSNYSGKVYGDIWGFETDRYFTSDDFNADGTYKAGVADQSGLTKDSFIYGPGDVKFKDLDNSGTIDGGKGTANDHGDLKVIGNTQPRYQYSFRLGGSWKGIDLDMFFQGVGKRSIWTQSAFVMPMMRGADALYDNQTNYWTEENPNANADFPRLWPGNAGQGTISVLDKGNHNFYPQSKYLVNMAYLRFKNLTVGYTLPQSITRKVYIEKLRIYFSANNLCELINKSNAPVDPEVNAGEGSLGNATWGRIEPLYRTISFGIQVTF